MLAAVRSGPSTCLLCPLACLTRHRTACPAPSFLLLLQGKAGSAPTAAELAAALQRHAFFLYCGHGGGEQYISGVSV